MVEVEIGIKVVDGNDDGLGSDRIAEDSSGGMPFRSRQEKVSLSGLYGIPLLLPSILMALSASPIRSPVRLTDF